MSLTKLICIGIATLLLTSSVHTTNDFILMVLGTVVMILASQMPEDD